MPPRASALPRPRTPAAPARTSTPSRMATPTASRLRAPAAPRVRSVSTPRSVASYQNPRLLTPAASPTPGLPIPTSSTRKRTESADDRRRPSPTGALPASRLLRPIRTPEPQTPARKSALRPLVLSKPQDAYPTPESINRGDRHVSFQEPNDSPPCSLVELDESEDAPPVPPLSRSLFVKKLSIDSLNPSKLRSFFEDDDSPTEIRDSASKLRVIRPLRVRPRSSSKPKGTVSPPAAPSNVQREVLVEVSDFMESWKQSFTEDDFWQDWLAFLEEQGDRADKYIVQDDGATNFIDLPPSSRIKSREEGQDSASLTSTASQKRTRRVTPLDAILSLPPREETRLENAAGSSPSSPSAPGSPPRIPLPEIPALSNYRQSLEMRSSRSPQGSAFPNSTASPSPRATSPLGASANIAATYPSPSAIPEKTSIHRQSPDTLAPAGSSSPRPTAAPAPSSPGTKPVVLRKPNPPTFRPSPLSPSLPPPSPTSSTPSRSPIIPGAYSPRRGILSHPSPAPLVEVPSSDKPSSLPTDISPLGLVGVSSGFNDALMYTSSSTFEARLSPYTPSSGPQIIPYSSNAVDFSKRTSGSPNATYTPPIAPAGMHPYNNASSLSLNSACTYSVNTSPSRAHQSPASTSLTLSPSSASFNLSLAPVPLEHPRTPPPPPQTLHPSPSSQRIGRSSSLLGLRSLFRRGSPDRDSASEDRRRRAESLKSMIGGPQRVSMAGLSVGLAERTIDLSKVALMEEEDESDETKRL